MLPHPEFAAMMLADGRLPVGAHTQSAGLEPALLGGLDPADVPDLVATRLATVVAVEAGTAVVARHKHILVVEEGTVVNGFGAYMASVIGQMDSGVRVAVHGVPDRFIEQAPRKRQLALVGLDPAGIARRVRALHESEAVTG